MILPYHTIVLAHHEGLTAQAIAVTIHRAQSMTARDLGEPAAHLAAVMKLYQEVCDFLQVHGQGCRLCSEFTRPSERHVWTQERPPHGRAPDMLLEGQSWWKVRIGDPVPGQPAPYS